jgi:anthranilate/para-aminobenzoate synthase component I
MRRTPRRLVWREITDYASLDTLTDSIRERGTCCLFERRGQSGFSIASLGRVAVTPITAREDAFASLRAQLREVTASPAAAPFPFHGGLWAVLDYEALCGPRYHGERSPRKPSGWIADLERYLIADHQSGQLYAAALIGDGETETSALSQLSAEVTALLDGPARYLRRRPGDQGDRAGPARAEAPPGSGYEESVRQAQRLMRGRGVHEVVISLAMSIEGLGKRRFGRLYREMRARRPAPYMAFFDSPELRLAVNSTLGCAEIRARQVRAETDAGTRNVGSLPPHRSSLAWDITGKERAEHHYAVEALRGDMSVIAAPGSVRVLTSAEPRRFGNVAHLFAEMEGTLRDEFDAVDAVAQLSPHGAVSGFPKERAIEIVPLVERDKRGLYGGLVGVFGFDGFASVATIIRSVWQEGEGAARARFGASITLGSEPQQEYRECMAKAEALLACLTEIPELPAKLAAWQIRDFLRTAARARQPTGRRRRRRAPAVRPACGWRTPA